MIGQAVRIVWPGGEHDFRFGIGELRALEQRLDAGSTVVLARLFKSEFKVDDVYETLRLGLQGGGMSERQAVAAIERTFPRANLFELAVTAARVLANFISWPTGDDADGRSGKTGGSNSGNDRGPLPNGKTRWASYVGAAAIMGWTPRELDRVTMWEFACAWKSWRDFNTTSSDEEDRPPEISDERMAELGIVGFN